MKWELYQRHYSSVLVSLQNTCTHTQTQFMPCLAPRISLRCPEDKRIRSKEEEIFKLLCHCVFRSDPTTAATELMPSIRGGIAQLI